VLIAIVKPSMPASRSRSGKRPRLAVDVAVHGRGDGEAVIVAQGAQRLERFGQLAGVEQRRQVGKHAGDFDAPGFLHRLEALDFARAGVPQPAQQHVGVLHRPAECAVRLAVGGTLGQGQRLGDEALVQVEDNRLVVGVADVGMAVVDKVKGLDSCHGCSPG
jgi:hypothetical protein